MPSPVPRTASLVAVVRNESKAASLAARGVQIRVADYTDPTGLQAALEGVDKLLLISSREVGQRLAPHSNVIEAAQSAGVSHVAYTSLVTATTIEHALAPPPQATRTTHRTYRQTPPH